MISVSDIDGTHCPLCGGTVKETRRTIKCVDCNRIIERDDEDDDDVILLYMDRKDYISIRSAIIGLEEHLPDNVLAEAKKRLRGMVWKYLYIMGDDDE
jgi:hypothetical protein